MAENLSIVQQIKALDEQRSKLLETAKAEALAKANEAVEDLNAMGFKYALTEVAALADTSKTIVEKALEQKSSELRLVACGQPGGSCGSMRSRLPSQSSISVGELARLSPAALKTAGIEVAPSVLVHVDSMAREAVERAERFACSAGYCHQRRASGEAAEVASFSKPSLVIEEEETDKSPTARSIVDLDPTTMQLHDRRGDGEPEARALCAALVEPSEAFQH